jgi:purine-binding chemotaxis protein CheW
VAPGAGAVADDETTAPSDAPDPVVDGADATPSPEPLGDAERTLRDRARRLADRPNADVSGEEIEVLVFRLRDEQYAVDLSRLRSVHRTRGLTPVPCTPPFVAGILNVRGEVHSVLDLATALGLSAEQTAAADAQVLLVELPRGRVGLLVDTVLGVERLATDRLDRALSGREFARGVDAARTTFLDLEQLLTEERFAVAEEAG